MPRYFFSVKIYSTEWGPSCAVGVCHFADPAPLNAGVALALVKSNSVLLYTCLVPSPLSHTALSSLTSHLPTGSVLSSF